MGEHSSKDLTALAGVAGRVRRRHGLTMDYVVWLVLSGDDDTFMVSYGNNALFAGDYVQTYKYLSNALNNCNYKPTYEGD